MNSFEEYIAVLKLVSEHIRDKTGVEVFLEPFIEELAEPHLLISFTGWEFESQGDVKTGEAKVYTACLKGIARLEAYGDGPDIFLPSILGASWRLNKLFESPFTVKFVEKASGGVTVKATSLGGRITPLGEEGTKPFQYVEEFSLELYMPFIEPLNKKGGE